MLPFAIVIFPHLAWLKGARDLVLSGLNDSAATAGTLSLGIRLCGLLVLTHLGLGLLVAFASGWPRRPRERAPVIDRNPVEPLARLFVYFFALMPAACCDRHRLRQRAAWPARSRRPAGGAVRPCGGGRCRRSGAALSRADGVVDLVRAAFGAAGPHRARHRAATVDGDDRLPGIAAGQYRGTLLRRQFPAPHRQAARLRHGRSTNRAAGRARRAEPAARLLRLGARAQPVGEPGRFP